MNYGIEISAVKLRDYAKARGWQIVPEAVKDRLYVLNHPDFNRRQLVFAMEESAPDYEESLMLAVEKLAELQQVPLLHLLNKIDEADDDTIKFRIVAPGLSGSTLPFSFTTSLLQSAQQLLLAAAHTVAHPQKHHPRLGRKEAEEFVETAHFRQTEPGSFVFKVSCPVFAVNESVALLPDVENSPFARRTVLTIKRALRELVTAIEEDTLAELINRIQREDQPLLSSNFCDALTHFQDDRLRNSLDIGIFWSMALAPPQAEADEKPIKIQRDYFSRIAEVHHALKPAERHKEDLFLGTVERLNGEMGTDGRRYGEVVLSLLSDDGELIKARADLNAHQYLLADKAHMTEGAYIFVIGKLHPGRQPLALTDISYFGPLDEPHKT